VTFLGASTQDLNFDFGEAIADGGDGTGTSGFGSPSNVSFQKQDGYGAGSFQFMTIDPNGEIIGTFSNGEIRTLGQVALATFPSQTGLKSIGQNLFLATRGSGEPTVGGPGTGGRGDLFAGSLEQSNVDLTQEFTQMIIAQRGYQANSRTISTADQLLAEVINIKR
jgi:flagellar hook protein FlgE